ncbi:zinc finger phd-type protein [Pyrenophora tritici-repentis]|nr:zinc finger phd-type protein [Pyrenophora tritici-repentis]
MAETTPTDYSLANPDTITKYKVAADISQKVLKEVSGWIAADASIVELCERGDKLLEEEVSKVYKGKKVPKGVGHCTTISPSAYITPYTPLKTDAEEAATTLKDGEVVKIQLGAQIDGFCAIVCDNVIVGKSDEVTGREADLILATHYANELLLRLMVPPGLVAHGDEEEQKKAASKKPYTQSQMTNMLEKVVKAYGCNLVESTTIWLFDHNEIESKKKIILAPGEGVKGEGLPEVGEVWGVEMGVSLGSGKVKTNGNRTTLHRRTATTYQLKRPTSRGLLSEVVKKFGTFPFSLRQLEDEKAAKVGVVECVRTGVLRQYEVVVDKDSQPVARLFSTVAITKNGMQRLAQPTAIDVSKPVQASRAPSNNLHQLAFPQHRPTNHGLGIAACKIAGFYANLAMPALRKSARERDFRSQQRSSTTPYASPTGTPNEPTHDKKQRSITEWTEPQPQTLAPSFEEHGFARHGVLENMAPLGVPPKAKDKQRARALEGPAPRNSLLAKSMAFGDEAGSTPEVKVSKTPVRGKTPVTGKTPVKNGYSKSTSVSASPAVQAISMSEPVEATTQRIQIAVNDAISKANGQQGRRYVGVALRRAFEHSKNDPELADAIDAIIHENSTDAQLHRFRKFIKMVKHEEKIKLGLSKDRRYDQASAVSHGSSFFSQQPSPRASSEIVPDDSVSAAYDYADQKPIKQTDFSTGNTHEALQSALDQKSTQMQPHPFSTAPALQATAESSADSTPRMPSKSPRKRATTNGDRPMEIDVGLSATAPTPVTRTPDTGASDSELSDVNEEIVQKGPPEPVQVNGKGTAAAAATAAKKAKNAAHARAAKKTKANMGKLFGKHAYKQQPPTAEQQAEEDRLYEMRKSLVEEQPIRHFEQNPPPVSDVRFDDEILETESLTESQIAVGPPMDSDQPRRAGRVPNHGTKRLREDPSRFSSPQFESAAATRPSTPAVGPAPKRVKLTNGQGARTKRSPVKNRDAGPIAGVAFTGGGGSRQLGPDDNDPHSPQSESDDFCSACRGAGEFVCCETCPRVFHLLCCDPPRTQVPDGAFYCYECNAKFAAHDDSADSHPSLGLLFNKLERTNPRAFALPQDIQNMFEGVSARPDGSYCEEVKKFPLAKNSGYGYQKPEYTKTLDAEQKVILCTQCGVSSGNKRQMLKCDFCHAYWHLDCVDPPLANPPHISLEASQRDAWRCPRHIENDLRSGLLLQNDLNSNDQDAEMADAAPVTRIPRKVRVLKKPEYVEPTFSRGMRNNGLIDIMNDSDDDTDGEGNYVFGENDPKDVNSKIFRVPEKGLILDFVSKVKSGRVAKKLEANKAGERAAQRKASIQHYLAHPIEQQQAALTLAQLAKKEPEVDLSEGKVHALIYGLTSEAPPNVITAMSNADPAPLTQKERAELEKLQHLINIRLGA